MRIEKSAHPVSTHNLLNYLFLTAIEFALFIAIKVVNKVIKIRNLIFISLLIFIKSYKSSRVEFNNKNCSSSKSFKFKPAVNNNLPTYECEMNKKSDREEINCSCMQIAIFIETLN